MTTSRWSRADATIAAALVAGTLVYCALLPRVLGDQDEAKDLYQALRLLAGARWFVDVFDLIPPGFHYLMAGAFAVGGASLRVARAMDAAMHATVALGVFVTARALGVSRGLATIAALADLCWARPAWPVTSPHWLSTALGVWAAWALLRPGRRGPTLAGVLIGLLATVQQQRAIPLAVAAVLVVTADWLLSDPRPHVGVLTGRLVRLAAGTAAVVLPTAGLLLATSGPAAVYGALILHPTRYGAANRDVGWGTVGPFAWFARYTFVRTLAWGLPAITAASAAVAVAAVARHRADRSSSVALAILSAAWLASSLYHPDYIHLAFVAPFLALVLAVLLARWSSRVPMALRGACVLVAAIVCVRELSAVAVGSWRDYPITHDTAFGRMQFRDTTMPERIDVLRDAIARSGSDRLFVYPFGAAFYLWGGATNPTPFQFLTPGYTTPEQYAAVFAALDHGETRLVILTMYPPNDPVAAWVHEHFVPVPDQPTPAVLFRRRDAG